MKIRCFRLEGVRCFEDTSNVELSPKCNIFVGKNNSGKSTLMQAIISWQIRPFNFAKDRRKDMPAKQTIEFIEIEKGNHCFQQFAAANGVKLTFDGSQVVYRSGEGIGSTMSGSVMPILASNWPNNAIVPFVAKRKAVGYGHTVSAGVQRDSDGTFLNLYAH